ncbi:MAG: hypothetical protein Q4C91_00080 [Eubacteriales bacterium]|nr:hypothetical protein [Eubacteriales bacterium]
MTDHERRFVELELKVWLRKLKREKAGAARRGRQNSWYREIEDTAKEYLRDVVYTGQGGYVLASEKPRMVAELQNVVKRARVNERLHQALFVDMDVEKVRNLAMELRSQMEAVMVEYKSHVERGNEYEQ